MNKQFYFFIIAVCIFLQSCEKEKIETHTRYLSGEWKLTKKEINGVNSTDDFNTYFQNYSITFFEQGNFNETYNFLGAALTTIEGTWLFQNHVNELKLADVSQTRLYNIIKLTADDLTIQLLSGVDKEVYYLDKK